MTTPSENDQPTAEQLLTLQQSIVQLLQGLTDGQERLSDRLTSLSDQQDNQAEAIANLVTIVEAQGGHVDTLTAKVDSLSEEVNVKVAGISQDLGEARGGHARSAVLRNAALVADGLDCQLISEVPQGILLGFSKVAAYNNEPPDDVKSFQQADLVLYVSDDQGRPRYLAVEASFTVAGRDIDRAVRNANYLTQYTGLRADPVVAGVEVLPEAQARIDKEEARLYRIERRDLQPD